MKRRLKASHSTHCTKFDEVRWARCYCESGSTRIKSSGPLPFFLPALSRSPKMSLTTLLLTPYSILLLPVIFYILPYLRNWQIRDIPAPFPAAWTNLWLLYQCRRGKRYLAVHEAHKKYGKLVRLQPHHVSIADADAIPQIYGHGNGFLKSEYYDAFVSIRRGLFNTRDRAEHTRKRKTVSHTF